MLKPEEWISVFTLIIQTLVSLGEMMELLPLRDLHILRVDFWEGPSNNHGVLMEYSVLNLTGGWNKLLWKHFEFNGRSTNQKISWTGHGVEIGSREVKSLVQDMAEWEKE